MPALQVTVIQRTIARVMASRIVPGITALLVALDPRLSMLHQHGLQWRHKCPPTTVILAGRSNRLSIKRSQLILTLAMCGQRRTWRRLPILSWSGILPWRNRKVFSTPRTRRRISSNPVVHRIRRIPFFEFNVIFNRWLIFDSVRKRNVALSTLGVCQQDVLF